MRTMIGAGLLALVLAACGPGADQADASATGASADAASPASQGTAAPAAQGGVPSASRQFRDWLAVCDNTNECAAFGPAENRTGWIKVAAGPGPDGRVSVALGVWGDTSASPGAVSFDIDGRRFTARSEQGSDDFRVAAGDVPALVAALGAGEAMTVSTGEPMEMSLSGAAAALLWIDERQGRLGTVAALVRRGDRPASAIPAAPAAPVVTPAPAVSQTGFGESGQTLPAALEALPAVKACREETAHSDWINKEVMSARLDASTELWAVPCFAGAYNIGHDWYLTGPGGRNPRPLQLPSSNGETSTGTINGGYAASARTIVAFAKGRGPGDCGIAQTWTWTGRTFVLSAETEMTECWGVPPDQWPTTWRTR